MSLEAYRAHQRTMRAFLDSQRQVIARLLTLEAGTKPQGRRFSITSLSGKETPVVPQPSEFREEGSPLGRFIARGQRSPNLRDKSHLGGVFLVVSDFADISRSLESRLVEHRAKSAVLPLFSRCNSESINAAVTEIREKMGPIAGIVFAQGIGQTEMPASLDEWRKVHQSAVKALFFLLQSCAKDLQEREGHVLVLSAMGGSFGRHQVRSRWLPASGAAVGLIKTAAIEWPSVSFKAIDLEDPDPDFLAQAVIDELLSRNDGAAEIGYLGKVRHIYKEAIAPLPLSPAPETRWQIEADSVFLVTGGARGITAQALGDLISPGMTLHILGRAKEPGTEPNWSQEARAGSDLRNKIIERAKASGREMTPALVEREISVVLRDREIGANLKGFREKGARVVYHSADVRDEVAIGKVIRSLYQEHGRIDAVIHGAGIIEDKLLIDKTADSFDRVFDTKADSTYLLSRYLRPESLKCLVFFASVAGRAGNRGQCDYAAANELVNRFAWWLHHRWADVRIFAINWGPWEGGMASAEVNRRFRGRGVIPISPAEGRTFFKRQVLFGPTAEVEIVAGYFEPPEKTNAPVVAWPLLQGAAVDCSGNDALWEGTLSLENLPFLNDHRIDDRIVIPWAVAVELMAEMVQAAWPLWHVTEAQNHRQLRGIIVEDSSALALRVTANLKQNGEFPVVEAMISAASPARQPFYEGEFVLRKEPPALIPGPPLTATAPASVPAKVFYAEHAFHGPSFRLIDLVTGWDKTGVDAVISPAGRGWNWLDSPWIFQPGILDAAMQVGSFWAQPVLRSFALPARAARIVRYGTYRIGDEESRLLARIRSATEQTINLDVFVLNKRGMVFLSAEGIEMIHSKALLRLTRQGPPV